MTVTDAGVRVRRREFLQMRTFPFKRRRYTFSVIFLLLTAAGLGACRRADLPAKDSPQYTNTVRAFYVGLSALQVGDDVRAEAKLKEATALAPDEPAAWADLGLLYMRQRQFDAAAANLEKARQLAPENAALYVLLGQLESARGNSAEAVKQFRRAAELDARNLKALYALSREVGARGRGRRRGGAAPPAKDSRSRAAQPLRAPRRGTARGQARRGGTLRTDVGRLRRRTLPPGRPRRRSSSRPSSAAAAGGTRAPPRRAYSSSATCSSVCPSTGRAASPSKTRPRL